MSPRPPKPPRDLAEVVSTDPARLAAYGRASGPYRHPPAAVAVPRDEADVSLLVRWAAEERLALVPRGAGTGMPGGNVGPGVVVDLSLHLDRVEAVDGGPARIRAGAGATGAAVAEAALRRGLFLPPLPSSADRCTVGGMVANNSAGARSFRYGSVRSWIVDLEVVLADGRRVRVGPGRPVPEPFGELHDRLSGGGAPLLGGWPQVRKNSSGYLLDGFLPTGDPSQLLAGCEGTLAVVTSATFRLAPEPRGRGVLLLPVASPDDLRAAVTAAVAEGAAACEFLGRSYLRMADAESLPPEALVGDPWALLLVEAEGGPEEVEGRLEAIAGAVGRASGRIATDPAGRERIWAVRHAASPVIARKAEAGLHSTQFIEDCVVPVDRLVDFLDGVDRILGDAGMEAVVFGHAGDGNVHVNPLVPVGRSGWLDEVREVLEATVRLVARLGGTLAGEHGDGRLRAPYLDRIWSSDHLAAFRAVKETLDPKGILNPGVILPLPGQDPLAGLWDDGGTVPDPAELR